ADNGGHVGVSARCLSIKELLICFLARTLGAVHVVGNMRDRLKNADRPARGIRRLVVELQPVRESSKRVGPTVLEPFIGPLDRGAQRFERIGPAGGPAGELARYARVVAP